MLPHKEIVLPEVDLSHDEGDPRWHAAVPDPQYRNDKDFSPVYREDGSVKWYRWNGLAPGHYREYWQLCVVEAWENVVARFEANPDDAYNAYYYIDNHPAFWRFDVKRNPEYPANHVSRLRHECTIRDGWPEITPHKVCPETNRVEDDDDRNTRLQWWWEFGPWSLFPDEHGAHVPTHDYELDYGADTYELALIGLAKVIHREYGNDRRVVDSEEWRRGGGDGEDRDMAEP